MNNLAALETVLLQGKSTSDLLDSLNRNEMEQLDAELDAKFYWNKRNPDWFKDESNKMFAKLRKVKRVVKKRLKTGKVKPELTENGSEIDRFNFPFGDTLDFSNRFLNQPGWEVEFQDSVYNAFWANKTELKLCTYCEGDVVMMKAPDETAFNRDRTRLAWWYADNK